MALVYASPAPNQVASLTRRAPCRESLPRAPARHRTIRRGKWTGSGGASAGARGEGERGHGEARGSPSYGPAREADSRVGKIVGAGCPRPGAWRVRVSRCAVRSPGSGRRSERSRRRRPGSSPPRRRGRWCLLPPPEWRDRAPAPSGRARSARRSVRPRSRPRARRRGFRSGRRGSRARRRCRRGRGARAARACGRGRPGRSRPARGRRLACPQGAGRAPGREGVRGYFGSRRAFDRASPRASARRRSLFEITATCSFASG